MPANFHARFSGVCKAGANCPKGGKVVVGDYVTWGREKGQRGIIYHVDCLNRPGQEYVPVNVEVEPITEPKLATTLVSSDRSDLAELLAESISKYLPKAESKLDEPRVLELIRANQAPQATEVIVHDARAMEVKEMGVQHCLFPSLLKVLSAKDASGHSLNVWLTGPAGSGKTTAARNCAEALNLEFRFCGALDNQYGLIG